MSPREQWMQDILARRREEGTYRNLRTPEQDRCFVDFTSNNYLGLGRLTDLGQQTDLEVARVYKVRFKRRKDDVHAFMVTLLCLSLRGPSYL